MRTLGGDFCPVGTSLNNKKRAAGRHPETSSSTPSQQQQFVLSSTILQPRNRRCILNEVIWVKKGFEVADQ